MSFFDTQNPGIGGLDELTDSETLVVQQIAALGDPNADRILFWDDSAGSYKFLTPGTGLTITGTTIDASAGGGTWGSITGTLSSQTDLQTALNAKQATITFGTGVQTALGVNIGSAGAPVLLNGALGTPSSGTLTNCTFPTLNQNTSGSAATLTTTRTIWGQNFNGSANVTGDITLGVSNITMTGSLAATGARVTKGWFTDIESTNMITIGGTSLTTVSQTFQNKTMTNSNNVLGGVTMTLGSDADGDIYYRSGGVLVRLAKGTASQQLRMNAGATAPEWFTPTSSGSFPVQDVMLTSGTGGMAENRVTSNTSGSLMFAINYGANGGSTATIYRLTKDATTSNYQMTHQTNLALTNSTSIYAIACTTTHVYVYVNIASAYTIRRYDIADLANVTTITGVPSGSAGTAMFSDGTDLYISSGASTFDRFTISGTALSNAGTITYTSSSSPNGAICDGTNVWMGTLGAGTGQTIDKYPKGGGTRTSQTTVTTLCSFYYWKGSSYASMFIGDSNMLGIAIGFSQPSDVTAVINCQLHLWAIALP